MNRIPLSLTARRSIFKWSPMPPFAKVRLLVFYGLIRHELEFSHWCVAKAVFLIRTYIGISDFSDHRWFNWLVLVRTCFTILSRSLSQTTGFMLSCPQQKGNRSKHIARKKVVAAHHVETEEKEQRVLNFLDMAKAQLKRRICRSDLVSEKMPSTTQQSVPKSVLSFEWLTKQMAN